MQQMKRLAIVGLVVILMATAAPSVASAEGEWRVFEKLAGGNGQDYIDGPAREAAFALPFALTVGKDGLVYIMDGPNLRVFDGSEVRTVASLWDQQDILKPWYLDNEKSIEAIAVNQMIAEGDRILLCGRIPFLEKHDVSYEFAGYSPEYPDRYVLYGWTYSFIMQYKDGKFSVISMVYSGPITWNTSAVALAAPEEEDQLKTYVVKDQYGADNVSWWMFSVRPWMAIAQDGSIYLYCSRDPVPLPPPEQRRAEIEYAAQKAREVYYSCYFDDRTQMVSTPYVCGCSVVNEISRIAPDGTVTPLTSWHCEIQERKFFPEDIQNQSIWFLPGEDKLMFYDGAYYMYSLDLKADQKQLERFSTTWNPDQPPTVVYSEYLVPQTYDIRFPIEIGDNVYAVSNKSIVRLDEGWRIRLIKDATLSPDEAKQPGGFAVEDTGDYIRFYMFDFSDMSLNRMSIRRPGLGEAPVTYVFSGVTGDEASPALYRNGNVYVPIEPCIRYANLRLGSLTPDGKVYIQSLTGRRVQVPVETTEAKDAIYMTPEDLETAINTVSSIKFKVTFDELDNTVYMEMQPSQ